MLIKYKNYKPEAIMDWKDMKHQSFNKKLKKYTKNK